MRQLAWMALLFSACSKPAPTQVTVTRSGCVDCHRPLDSQGMAHGIEANEFPDGTRTNAGGVKVVPASTGFEVSSGEMTFSTMAPRSEVSTERFEERRFSCGGNVA